MNGSEKALMLINAVLSIAAAYIKYTDGKMTAAYSWIGIAAILIIILVVVLAKNKTDDKKGGINE